MTDNSFEWGGKNKGTWNNRKKSVRVSDVVPTLDVSDGEWHEGRLIGPTVIHRLHWITIQTKPGGKIVTLPKTCLEAHGPEGTKCPYCENFGDPSPSGFSNFLSREEQENAPKKDKPPTEYESKARTLNGYKAFYKNKKGVGSWTPNTVLPINSTLGQLIDDTVDLNKVTNKKTGEKKCYPPNHPKFGYNISVKYDESKKSAQQRWSVQKGERVPLEEEELDYLLWKIPDPEVEKEKEAEKNCKDLMKKACSREGEPQFPDVWEGGDGKKKKKKANQYSDEYDDNEDIEDDEDDRRSKSKKKKKTSSRYDDDDDEDERPKKSKKRSSSYDDDDDDDAEIDDDEDEEDDEDDRRRSRKSTSKSKSKVKSKSRRRDDDDDDDDDSLPF